MGKDINVIRLAFERRRVFAEQLAPPADYVIETMGAPDAVGGLAIAILVATPEAIGAVRAAVTGRYDKM